MMQEDVNIDVAVKEKPIEGIVFDLETFVFNGHDILWAVLKKLLDKKGDTINSVYYMKRCLSRSIKSLANELAQEFGVANEEEEFVAELKEAYAQALVADGKARDGVTNLVKNASKNGFAVAILSTLDEEITQQLLEKAGLSENDVTVCPYIPRTANRFMIKHWRAAASELSVAPGLCIAFTSDHNSCKMALASDMRVVVIPTELSSFQDFSGANIVVDALDTSVIKKALKLLERE